MPTPVPLPVRPKRAASVASHRASGDAERHPAAAAGDGVSARGRGTPLAQSHRRV